MNVLTNLVPWVDDTDLTDDEALKGLRLPSGVELSDICAASTEYLWLKSGARYDAHEVTVRPHHLVASCGCAAAFYVTDWACGCYAPELLLPRGASNITVTVDGVELADSDWVLVDGIRLVRVGNIGWPCCQSLSLPDGSPGTWSVKHTVGTPVTPLGAVAARELALHVALQLGGKDSKLPKGTTSVSRTGVQIQLDRPKRGSKEGTTSLPLVELFLNAANPDGRRRAPSVASPDTLVGGRIS